MSDLTDADLAAIGVAPCTEGGGHCRCVENRALIRAYRKGREDEGISAPPERVILQDLIAELRNKHCAEPESRLQCQWCESDWPCPEARAADRAKQRLREVSGE